MKLTGDDLFSQLLMQRVVDDRTCLLVEGVTDIATLEPHVNPQECEMYYAGSKSALFRALELARAAKMAGVCGIADRDVDHLLGLSCNVDGVIVTDEYDMEATALWSGRVLDRVVTNYSDPVRRRYAQANGLNIAACIVALAGVIGVARYVSRREGFGISLRRVPLHRVVGGDLDVNIGSLAQVAHAKSRRPRISARAFADAVWGELLVCDDLRQFCCGHDLACALAVILKRLGGRAGGEAVERAVRTAFGPSELRGTRVYAGVDAWCADVHRATLWH